MNNEIKRVCITYSLKAIIRHKLVKYLNIRYNGMRRILKFFIYTQIKLQLRTSS